MITPDKIEIEQRLEMILQEAQFLCDRLDSFEPDHHDAARQYYGHVDPSHSRLKGLLAEATPSHSPANQGEGEVFERIKPFVDAIPQPIRNAQLRHVPTPEREIFVPSALKITPTPQPAEAEARGLYSMAHDPCIGSEEAVSRIAAALQGKAEAERENDALARDRNDLTEALLLSEAQLAERTRERDEQARFKWEAHDANKALQAERTKLVEALAYYADQFCEQGKYSEICGKLSEDECSGCLARAALSNLNEKEPG